MAMAAAVEEEFAGRLWGNDPDIDYEYRMVAITCVGLVDAAPNQETADTLWLRQQVQAHGGIFVDSDRPALLMVFQTLIEATACLRRLHKHFGRRIRTGVNLAEFLATPNGRPGGGSDFAMALMDQCEPGGMCMSAVVEARLTSRMRADDFDAVERGGWWAKALFAIQLGALLAYFLGWYYGIYWRIESFVEHGGYPCWPQWLCG